ncbi:MAG: nickel pincer cofactor biosynthesis protein LarC [Methanobacterium sp.]|uniref:nickel pincer cofactor biosynthesis protein LarC n=1 Tax=Methanobacterium sp. TaxID=2164 RepID=UPI003D65AD28|nr:nickel pincer cofactor biosynthesis protein LarC [Methanobacterium sp.]
MVVVIDPQNSGISGNMVLGALIDIGIDIGDVVEVMEYYASYFGDISVKINNVQKASINATYANVETTDKKHIEYSKFIKTLGNIKHEKIDDNILKFSKDVFNTLARAEAEVHGTSIDKVHFHEVGAADAVADVIGSAYCFYKLGLNTKKVYGMPVALGGGRIKSMHGNLSVPAPATLEILKNVPVFGGPENHELTTPTGAALYMNMVDEFCSFYPLITNRKIGYGAGKLDLEVPNILRIISGDSSIPTDNISILETNLDSVTGEVIGHTFDKLLDAGALDVVAVPILMKKNRPGHLLRVITKPKDCDAVSEAIIRETGTLGVRILPYVHRNIVNREIIPINIEIAGIKKDIQIKVGTIGDEIINYSPEYEDAKKIANEMNIPLKDVMKKANDAFKKLLDKY